jgi:hypothetical protein
LKKHIAATGRFVVGNGGVFSIVEPDDELTVFLGVAGMTKEMILPIPLGTSDIYLGAKWTIQRSHRRNLEYHRLLASNMKAYGDAAKITIRSQRIVEELSIAGDIVRKICWDSYPKGPFKGGFKVFDTTLNDWVLVSVEEAVRRTMILLRLKKYFSVIAAYSDCNGFFLRFSRRLCENNTSPRFEIAGFGKLRILLAIAAHRSCISSLTEAQDQSWGQTTHSKSYEGHPSSLAETQSQHFVTATS